MTQTDELQETLTALAVARLDAESSKEDLAYLKRRFERQYIGTIERTKRAVALVEELDAKVRALALAAYTESKDTKPAPGISIGLSKKIALTYDTQRALAWARETNMALTLDVKAFEEIAKAASLEFVTKAEVETQRVAIANDLTKFYDLPPAVITPEEPTPMFTPGYPQEEPEGESHA